MPSPFISTTHPEEDVRIVGSGELHHAIVFLHPGLGTVRSWGTFPEQLCAAVAAPGLIYTRQEYDGEDTQPVLPADFIDREAERLERLLTRYGIEHALLVGSSDGATIALVHASRFPRHVRAVVSMAAHAASDRLMIEALARIKAEIECEPAPSWLLKLHGTRGRAVAQAWCTTWEHLIRLDWNIENLLGRIACPVLALQGSDDANGLPAQLQVIERLVSGSSVRLLNGLGHFLYKEAPELVLALICDFVVAFGGLQAMRKVPKGSS
jgi:pimeloyl-ACP methyl ester carboxylesterase